MPKLIYVYGTLAETGKSRKKCQRCDVDSQCAHCSDFGMVQNPGRLLVVQVQVCKIYSSGYF